MTPATAARGGDDIDVTVVIACYNEATHLEQSVAELLDVLERMTWSAEVVFVEDRSPDDTARLVAALVKKHGERLPMRAIYHAQNTGRGRAVSDGMAVARGRMVGYLDIDLEVHARYIPSMLAAIEAGADVAIAQRHYRLSPTPWFLMRHLLSRAYRMLSNRLLDLGGLDTEAGFKFFDRAGLGQLLPECHDPGWFWDTEIMTLARRRGLRVVEIPCLFLRRGDKRSTLRVIPATIDYLRKLRAFRRRLGAETRPRS